MAKTFTPYKLGLGFGQKAPTPSGTEHGQDIETPLGTPLFAGIQGTAHVHEDNVLGRYVTIDGPGGVQYWFGHLGSVAVKDGQVVTPATQIGMTGGAQNDPQHGDATGPHLWFATKVNGQFVNPLQHLNQQSIFQGQPGSPGGPVSGVQTSPGAEQPAPPPRNPHEALIGAASSLAQLLAPQLGVDAETLSNSLVNVGYSMRQQHLQDSQIAEGPFAAVHQAVSDQLGGYQPNESEPPEHLTGMIQPPAAPYDAQQQEPKLQAPRGIQ